MAGIGLINEQGYNVGQFGYTPLNEADNKAVQESEKKKKAEEEKNKKKGE